MAGLNKVKAVGNIQQSQHLDDASSQKVTGDVMIPGKVITADISAAGVLVGVGSLLRIRVAATTYIAFGSDSSMAAVTGSTSPALELFSAGVYMVVATDNFIRASAAVPRLEIIDDARR